MKKHIKVKYIEIPEMQIVVLQVIEQTHRGKDFGNSRCYYTAPNGVTLYSVCQPEVIIKSPDGCVCHLYVRGTAISHDNAPIPVPIEYWDCIKRAIRSYNEEDFENPDGEEVLVGGIGFFE